MIENTSESVARPATASKGPQAARIVYFALAAGGLIALVVIVRHFSSTLGLADVATIVDRHGPAVLGIPAAALAAFIIVAFVRALEGPIAFDLLGLKAEGAGATTTIMNAASAAAGIPRTAG